MAKIFFSNMDVKEQVYILECVKLMKLIWCDHNIVMEECWPISSHPLTACTTSNSQTCTAHKSEQIQSLNINTGKKFTNKEI